MKLLQRLKSLPVKALLGIGDEDQLELLHVNARSWRPALAGAALVNLIVAWAFKLVAPGSALWVWAALGWSAYASFAVICYVYETRPQTPHIFKLWVGGALALSTVVGIVWSSLAWWLPPTASLQLMAALASCLISLASASASASVGTLLCVCLPALLIVPAALWWHAHLPLAAGVVFGLELVFWRHGLQLHRNMMVTIRQRRQVQVLSRELGVMGERQRLLRDMHDGVGASLISAIKLIEQGQMSLDEAAQLLRDCLDDLRLVIDSLEPIEHDLVTLLATLRYRLGDRLERAGIVIEWAMADLPPLPWLHAAEALEVLRIAQEALANILKHAQATRVRVSLSLEQDAVIALRLEDNGLGFNPDQATVGRGLRHMQQRAALIGGQLTITATPGSGTRLCLRLPLQGRSPPEAAR